ncbi:hypothetical protein Lfu02_24220 [Longispora fulva]|uniref:Uncharacterized protein n=1 Tax=Longispora fulva TaxID=619741 RepID=A0A8J7GM82_9ACTN|nr:hypothetical protein [Longispora fulva]MBG6139567.1 hypothetical protein [Longispora fulva]GIG58050.1 hypothetical protein Lfu02_24220 [Longispora fulva]
MTDFDQEARLHGAFAAFRAESMDDVAPAGTDAVRATVRHQRKVRNIALGVLALTVMAAPVAAYATLTGDPHGPPPAIPGGTASATPTESPSLSPSPTPSPSASKAAGVQLTKADLDNATLDIQAWNPAGNWAKYCATGPVTFTAGYNGPVGFSSAQSAGLRLVTDRLAYTDVDHDGSTETLVTVFCGQQGGDLEVIAVHKNPDGAIETVGLVVATAASTTQVGLTDDRVAAVRGIEATPEGAVRVEVADAAGCCGFNEETPQRQWRTYTWKDGAFRQTGGPTRFPLNPHFTDLAIESASTTPDGTLTVKVHNKGPVAAPFFVYLSGMDIVSATGCVRETNVQPAECSATSLASGATVTLVLKVTGTTTAAEAEVGINVGKGGANGSIWRDTNFTNNTVKVTPPKS